MDTGHQGGKGEKHWKQRHEAGPLYFVSLSSNSSQVPATVASALKRQRGLGLTLVGQHVAFLPFVDDMSFGHGILPRLLCSAGAVFSDYPGNGSFVQHFCRGALGKPPRSIFNSVTTN